MRPIQTKHGTLAMIRKGCRCAECREEKRRYAYELYHRRIKESREYAREFYHANRDRKLTTEPSRHGLSGYNNNGCRCTTCMEAKRAYNREYMREHRAKVNASARS
jgi:hypothetical protein